MSQRFRDYFDRAERNGRLVQCTGRHSPWYKFNPPPLFAVDPAVADWCNVLLVELFLPDASFKLIPQVRPTGPGLVLPTGATRSASIDALGDWLLSPAPASDEQGDWRAPVPGGLDLRTTTLGVGCYTMVQNWASLASLHELCQKIIGDDGDPPVPGAITAQHGRTAHYTLKRMVQLYLRTTRPAL